MSAGTLIFGAGIVLLLITVVATIVVIAGRHRKKADLDQYIEKMY